MTFKKLITFYQEKVFPQINQIDRDSRQVKHLLQEFIQEDLLRTMAPAEYGGIVLTPAEKIILEETMGHYGGVFAFLMMQTMLFSGILNRADDKALIQKHFTDFIAGKKTYALGTAQLRMANKILIARQDQQGYRLDGKIPFASGFDIFSHIAIGFTIDDEREGYALLPFENQPGMQCSAPMQSLAMAVCNTVSIQFDNYHLTDDMLLFFKPQGDFETMIVQKRRPSVYLLGVAQAAVELSGESRKVESSDKIATKLSELQEEINHCREALQQTDTYTSNIPLHARMIEVAMQATQFCLLLHGGRGMLADHSAQRLYREVAQLAISRQTIGLLEHWVDCSSLPPFSRV